LICYKISQIEEDIVSIKEIARSELMEKQLQYGTDDSGTRFQVECPVPPPADKDYIRMKFGAILSGTCRLTSEKSKAKKKQPPAIHGS